jgi:hypothetical protein
MPEVRIRVGKPRSNDSGLRQKITNEVEALNVFLSYSSKDRRLAGRLKENLQFYGIRVFLAHEDITPSHQWLQEIIKNMKACDVFLPLLTREFSRSNWTDQEAGMAVVLSKHVMPLSVGGLKPYGFLAGFQALKLNQRTLDKCCVDILMGMVKQRKLREKTQNSFVESLTKSGNFDEAKEKSKLLEKLGPYNKEQVRRILQGYLENNQISGSWSAGPRVRDFLVQNSQFISSELDRLARDEDITGIRLGVSSETVEELVKAYLEK